MIETKPNFIEFRSFGSRIGSNYIGITGGGSMSFYSGFYKNHKISTFTKCLIMYDKALKLVALKFGGDELGKGTFPLNHNKESNTGWISAQNFFRLNTELKLNDIKGKYEPKKYNDPDKGNMFIIDLNKRIEVRR